MNRLHIATREFTNWRTRLAKPDGQWKRKYSAFETAVSWEYARNRPSGLPEQIEALFIESLGKPDLLFAVAEHQVDLAGSGGSSQCDVWGLVQTPNGKVSLSVEAKVSESFGNKNLGQWLFHKDPKQSSENRQTRWDYIEAHLPVSLTDSYNEVAYQLLHRCATAVIEAKRFKLNHAFFVVQAFNSPDERFDDFANFCKAIDIQAERGQLQITKVNDIQLYIAWVDCPPATNEQIVEVATA